MTSDDSKNRILYLIDLLNKASDAYYNEDREIISNLEYDKYYDELKKLEEETGIHYSNSPTNRVGYNISKELVQVRHESPMLSLDKTKSVEDLESWLGDKEGILSYKLDGLTIVLTYENGVLTKGVTRGNGEIGELVTDNVKKFLNVPIKIKYNKHIIIRGEAIITYSDFENINKEIDEDFKYKNPRNLCSGSVRQLDPNVTKNRYVRFFAFSMIESDAELEDTYEKQLDFLSSQGFDVVYHKKVDKNNISDTIKFFEKDILENDNPSDGLVLMFNDIAYGKSLGRTAKFPRNAIAFKWKDETAETTLREVVWSPSRTGLINPVAVFDAVELEGTTVKRASLHNLSIMEELQIGIGDKIKVYKANMIIPQIAENITKSNSLKIIKECPICKSKLHIHNDNGVKTLHCENLSCPVKHIKSFENFVSKNCMDIDGISIATIEKFIVNGYIKEFADLYKLDRYKNEIINLEGFGEKSYDNIINSINKEREVDCYRFINSLGINGIGTANAKVLSKYYNDDLSSIMNAKIDELCEIDSIGPILAENIYNYLNDKNNKKIIEDLLKEVKIKTHKKSSNLKLEGLTFVITGNLLEYNNRDELVKEIEEFGGKVSGSVSSKTNYLINNDINSQSSKNKTAKKLNVNIITEKMYKEMIK